MTGPDDFDDFLRRRKPLFDRTHDDDVFEPPAELDRIVLRQARDAIEAPRQERVYRAPRWTAPFAVAATLAVAFTVVWQLMPTHRAETKAAAEISMQKASRRVDAPAEAPASVAADAGAGAVMSEAAPSEGTVVVQLAPPAAEPMPERALTAAAPPPPPPAAADAASTSEMRRRMDTSAAAPTVAAAPATPAVPAYRQDEKAWLAEIARLRAAGDTTRADAESAEFMRQHRAYASGPDR